MSPDDLGVDLGESAIELTELVEPESESDTELFEGSAEDTAGQLAEFLRESGVGA
jgi:electron transfer flavoprotein beta subunit